MFRRRSHRGAPPARGRGALRAARGAAAAIALGVIGFGAAAPVTAADERLVPDRSFSTLFAVWGTRADTSRPWSRLFPVTAADALGATPAAATGGLAPPGLDSHAGGDVTATALGVSSGPSITWGPLLLQSLGTLVFQHAVRAGFEKNTWQKTLDGPFWDDYVNSVKNLCCWVDGDKWTTNWLFHPIEGAAAAFLFANNHRDSKITPPGWTGKYWSAKGKQGLWAFAYSTYFEIGPVLSECAIGNIGLSGEGQTWHDIVITPAMGTLLSVGEDVLRDRIIDPIDRWNHFWGATAALFLNPTRTFTTMMALKVPWADPPWLTLRREARARERVRSEIRPPSPAPASAVAVGPR